jgi:hypothetical protein
MRLEVTTRALVLVTALTVARTAHAGGDVTTVRLPDGGFQPQAAIDSEGNAHVIYFKGDPQRGDVFYTRLFEKDFTPPIRVNGTPQSAVAIGTIRGPHLAIGKENRVHVAWMGSQLAEPKAKGKEAPMLYTRMNDERNGFEPERNVIQRATGLDGGGSVAADGEGNVYVAWHAPTEGAEGEEARTVWVARSKDDGETFEEEQAARSERTGACGCCGMRIVAAGEGQVFVIYRTASEMVNRDINLLVSRDGGSTFSLAHADPWEIGQCVMSTASFAKLPNGAGTVAAWETKNKIRIGRLSPDADEAVRTLTVPGTGENPKHPTLACNASGETLVAWTEGTAWNKGGKVAWQLLDASGNVVKGSAGRVDGLPAWGVPAVAVNEDQSFTIIF